MYRVLDLFSGIGGFSLGLERTGGFRTVAFCEIEPYCRAVLKKHWPDVPCYEDVRTLTANALERDGIAVDVICGGFPCQDVSFAGKRAGLEGARSGLWSEYGRLIGELRPRFVIVENVPGLLSLGMGTVLGSLSTLGYDATWDCVPASAVGAPHRRDRVWLVAYARGQQHQGRRDAERGQGATELDDTGSQGRDGQDVRQRPGQWTARPSSPFVADPECLRQQTEGNGEINSAAIGTRQTDRTGSGSEVLADAQSDGRRENVVALTQPARAGQGTGQFAGSYQSADRQWLTEPDVGRVAHGVPSRVDRLRSLGNAVVPQIPELIGRAILQAEGRLT